MNKTYLNCIGHNRFKTCLTFGVKGVLEDNSLLVIDEQHMARLWKNGKKGVGKQLFLPTITISAITSQF